MSRDYLKLDKDVAWELGIIDSQNSQLAIYIVPFSALAERGQKYVLANQSRNFGRLKSEKCYPAFKDENGSFLHINLYKKWKAEADNEPFKP